MQREVAKLNGHLQGITNIKKQMASKFDRLSAERETVMKAQDALNRKVIIITNLHEKERQTITKLTAIADELRKDRVDYMNKTNSALRAHKEHTNKAENLQQQLETALTSNKALALQLDAFKEKSKQSTVDLGGANQKIKFLEGEVKKFQKALSDAQNSDAGSRVYEAKIATIEKEKKNIEAQLKSEQRKVDQLTQEIRQIKIAKMKSSTEKKKSA